jgi:hypothetical protein
MCGVASEGRIGAVPVCPRCEPVARRHPVPGWLKGSGVLLGALLVANFFWGARHWEPARDYVLASRAAASGDWRQAASLLTAVLDEAPGSEPALLLKIKADLLSGDPDSAFRHIEMFGDRKTSNPLLAEINQKLARVEQAGKKAAEGRSLAESNQDEAALAAFAEAAEAYPEFEGFQIARDMAEANVAFGRHDYASFTATARRLHKARPEDPTLRMMLASGLAAQYAASGDESFMASANAELEQALAAAGAQPDPELVGYAERIRYRLATREIITTEEYERRKQSGEQP